MPLPLMLLPLLAAGIGVGGRIGLDWLEGEEEEGRVTGMLEALRSARTAVPGSEVGPTGPELPEYRTDWSRVGEALLESGDPAGLSIAMRADMGRAEAAGSAAASTRAFEEKMALERYKQEQQNLRQGRELEAQRRQAEMARAEGMQPLYHAPGSKVWSDITEEGTSLKYAGSVIRDFQEAMSTYGTESWGELSGALGAKRQQLMLFLKAAEQTGTIDAGTTELFDELLPDPTRMTGDLLNQESGKLNALVDLFNSKYIPAYQARSLYTSNVPDVGFLAGEDLLPEGLVEVDEGQMMREAELMSELDAEARQRAGGGVSYAPQRRAEKALDTLTERARSGQLFQRR